MNVKRIKMRMTFARYYKEYNSRNVEKDRIECTRCSASLLFLFRSWTKYMYLDQGQYNIIQFCSHNYKMEKNF